VLASEILSPARVLGKDPPPGTYSDAALLSLLDLVCLDVITQVKFPFARISTPTVAGVGAYQLPETPIDDGTGCVWLNGQLLVKTDIATLQGQQIGNFDSTGFGAANANSDGPAANAGSFVPSWTVQPPTSFPMPTYTNQVSFTAPWYAGRAPGAYAIHGGDLIVVPPPNANAPLNTQGQPIPNLVMDVCISNAYAGPYVWNGINTQTPTLQQTGQRIWFPSNFKNALVWGLAERIATADDTGSTKEARNYCGEQFREQIRELLFWARSYRSYDRINYQTNRSRYVGARWRRNTQYGGGYP
jgi:hypothetical protein